MSRTCFVIMRIGAGESEDFQHFQAIYANMRSVLSRSGYDVTRADDITRSGAITREIVTSLHSADLVLADLTDLNPNVFYELGVRHTLRRSGTLMVLDTSRTPEIPFDLSAYRVVYYKGELTGMTSLAEDLESFLVGVASPAGDALADNPVHDWIPTLPPDLTLLASSSDEILHAENAALRARLDAYRKAYGDEPETMGRRGASPLSRVMAALNESEHGNLPVAIMAQFLEAARGGNQTTFLQVSRRVVERRIRIGVRGLAEVASWANQLDLGDVATAMLEYGLELYPTDKSLQRSVLARLARSSDREELAKAISEIMATIGIDGESGMFLDPSKADSEALGLFGILMDALGSADRHDEALRICRSVNDQLPNRSTILRNLAREVEEAQGYEAALEFFRLSLAASDADDTSASWTGNTLHNVGRHVDAAEVYLTACWADPTDGNLFAHVADEVSIAVFEPYALRPQGLVRAAPEAFGEALVLEFIAAALSCTPVSGGAVDRCRRAAERADIELATPDQAMSRRGRRQLVAALYTVVSSELTREVAEALKPRPAPKRP